MAMLFGPVAAVPSGLPHRRADIFAVLTDPTRHLELDGSGMLRGAVTTEPVKNTVHVRHHHEVIVREHGSTPR